MPRPVRILAASLAACTLIFAQMAVSAFACPGLYFIGCTPPDRDERTAAPNHSPRFYVDENCLKLGVKTLCALALDWLSENAAPR